jgi:hypothetical protein
MKRSSGKRPSSEPRPVRRRPDRLVLLCVLAALLISCSAFNQRRARPLPVEKLFTLASFDPAVQAAALKPGVPAPDSSGLPEYRIELEIASDLASYTGSESIALPNRTGQTVTNLNLLLLPELAGGGLQILSLRQEGRPLDFSVEEGYCSASLAEALAPGDTTLLEVSFHGRVPSELHNPGIFLHREGYVSLGGFYPALAPLRPDGSWSAGRPTAGHGDPPAIMLANYLVRVSAPAGLRFAASGLVVRGKQEPGKNVVLAVSGPVREFYLCGAGDWRRLRIRRQGVTISSYYPPGSRQPGINAAYYAADALRIFERRYGPYPYSELDVVSAPLGTQGLGMEYPGIIVITNELYDPDGRLGIYGADFLQEGIAAHEVAHQWFYNLVGSDPVSEPWLDEAFAQYATWLYFSTIRGEWGGSHYYTSMENRWSRIRLEPIPIGLPVAAYNEQEYGAIIYGRAPIFLFTLNRTGGQERFETLINRYIDLYRWREADTAGFGRLLAEFYPLEAGELLRHWVLPED